MGYQRRVKGYRLWSIEPNNQKILISRDVVFKEDEMPYLRKKSEETQFEVELGENEETEDAQDEIFTYNTSGTSHGGEKCRGLLMVERNAEDFSW